MIEIINCRSGKKSFKDSRNPYIDRSEFAKIERLRPDSVFFQLWRNEDSDGFYLFDEEKGRYVMTGSDTASPRDSKEFSQIKFYSEETRSFVAYCKNGSFYLFFEDGKNGLRDEQFIGEEHYGKRPVQKNGEWSFYDCENREWVKHFSFKGHKNELLRWLCGNHFETKFKTKFGTHRSVTKYKEDDEFIKIPGYFSEVDECPADFIIGKTNSFDNSRPYSLIRNGRVVGTYVSKPLYDAEHECFIAKRETQWYIIRKKECCKVEEVTNVRWQTSEFEFFGNFILNKSPEKGWLIFDAKTGCWVCQDWRNIRIDKVTDTPSLIVDTENLIDYRVGIDGIQKHIDDCLAYYSKLLEKKCCNSVGVSSKSIESLESIQKQSASCDEDEFIEQGMMVKTTKPSSNVFYDFECENKMPKVIKFIVFPRKGIKGRKEFYSDLQSKDITIDDFICWVFEEDNAIVITKKKSSLLNRYTCVFRKVYDADEYLMVDTGERPNGFKVFNACDVDEYTLIAEIDKWLEARNKGKKTTNVAKKAIASVVMAATISQETLPQTVEDEPASDITAFAEERVVDEPISICTEEKNIDDGNCEVGEVNLLGTKLAIGDTATIKSLFGRKSYRILDNAMIILVDEENLIGIDYRRYSMRHYNIVGEGKDFRFPQDFNKNNSAIRDNVYPIYLFKPCNDEECEFVDHVVCRGYSMLKQCKRTNQDVKQREIINFELESMCYENDWFNG